MNQLDAIAKRVALVNRDDWWQSVAASSLIGKSANWASQFTRNLIPQIGSYAQVLGFVGLTILFAVLAAPWFVDDKEGLALISLASAGMWTLGYFLGGKESRDFVAIDIPVLLFFAINIIATASSHYMHEAIHGLLKLLVYIAAYFFFTAVLRHSTKRKHITLWTLIGTALLVVFYGLYQYKIGVAPLATWEDPSIEDQGTRIFSTLNNPNLLSGYLMPVAPMATALSIAAFVRKKIGLGIGLGSASALICVGIVLTGCRGGFLALAVGMGTIGIMVLATLWQSQPSKRGLLVAIAVILPIVLLLALHFFVPAFDQRVRSIFAGHEHSSNAYRLKVYETAWKMLRGNWWIGVGPGNKAFVSAYGLYMYSGINALGAYCVPLEVAVEAGVLALASFICIVFSALARGHVAFWSGTANPDERWLAAGASAGIIAMMVMGVADTVFYRPQVQFLFWLLISLLVTVRINPADKLD